MSYPNSMIEAKEVGVTSVLSRPETQCARADPPTVDPQTGNASAKSAVAPALGNSLPATVRMLTIPFNQLSVKVDPSDRAVWCAMRASGTPNFNFELLREMDQLRSLIQEAALDRKTNQATAPQFLVFTSEVPGIFNLGGDLNYFLERIKVQDRDSLLSYARACIRCIFEIEQGIGGNVVTLCVVQGDALGGGMEAALAFNVILAERGVKMGLPESMFGAFPGMGAYSLLSRKIGPVQAERMILSGRMYTAEELHEMGIVNVLADPGRGAEAARQFMNEYRNRFELLLSLNKVRRSVNPLSFEELEDITTIWVDSVLKLSQPDLRRMELLIKAQDRRMAGGSLKPEPRL